MKKNLIKPSIIIAQPDGLYLYKSSGLKKLNFNINNSKLCNYMHGNYIENLPCEEITRGYHLIVNASEAMLTIKKIPALNSIERLTYASRVKSTSSSFETHFLRANKRLFSHGCLIIDPKTELFQKLQALATLGYKPKTIVHAGLLDCDDTREKTTQMSQSLRVTRVSSNSNDRYFRASFLEGGSLTESQVHRQTSQDIHDDIQKILWQREQSHGIIPENQKIEYLKTEFWARAGFAKRHKKAVSQILYKPKSSLPKKALSWQKRLANRLDAMNTFVTGFEKKMLIALTVFALGVLGGKSVKVFSSYLDLRTQQQAAQAYLHHLGTELPLSQVLFAYHYRQEPFTLFPVIWRMRRYIRIQHLAWEQNIGSDIMSLTFQWVDEPQHVLVKNIIDQNSEYKINYNYNHQSKTAIIKIARTNSSGIQVAPT